MNITARRLRSSATTAGAGLLLAAAGAVLAPPATAAAADTEPPELSVSTAAPAEIGLAGGLVGFTTTASNTGAVDASSARLGYRIDGGEGQPPNAVSLQYRLGTTAWKTVPLTLTGTEFAGELPDTFPLAAGRARTVQLRLGLPMGTPHNGDSNGGTDHLHLLRLVGLAHAEGGRHRHRHPDGRDLGLRDRLGHALGDSRRHDDLPYDHAAGKDRGGGASATTVAAASLVTAGGGLLGLTALRRRRSRA
ncbi:hypothetical protein [Streptomyces sp. NPDC048462]|uniref:hypothetical protein n=1 Tax=Streptomyces sp. NPDC048462 TaxID=3365555 RepID=UPI00372449E0